MEGKSTYRQILKATSVFGSVQVFNVIVSLVRSKLIAIWIGPVGMGIAALLTSTVNIVSGLSSLGIEISAVRHISAHFKEGDPDSVSVPAAITRRIALYTGLAGAMLACILSPWLSELTFGDPSHALGFAWLSVTLLLRQLTNGELAILQGLRRIRWLARANLLGNLLGLAVSAPLYYFFRIDAIVPAIIVMSVATMVTAFAFSLRIRIRKPELKRKELFLQGRDILRLGAVMTLSSVLTVLGSWAVQVYISHRDGTAMVGFYNAGFTLLNSYVGLLFTAMGTDYFPRLSALVDDREKMFAAVREQSVIGLLIITPVIAFFLAFAKTVIQVLFTGSFAVITLMVSLGMAGMLFRTVSFTVGYMVLALNDTKLFVKTAVGFNVLLFGLSLAGYHLYGLTGLGAAFIIHYLCHFLILTAIAKVKYGFTPNAEFTRIFAACLIITAVALFVALSPAGFWRLPVAVIIILASSAFSLWQINSRVDLLALIQKLKSK